MLVWFFRPVIVFNDTIANNLRVARPGASDDDLWQALEMAKLAARVRAMPDGMETEIGAAGVHLS